jgi:hypothetical protein
VSALDRANNHSVRKTNGMNAARMPLATKGITMGRLPSRWWHILSVFVFLFGAVGAPIVMVSTLVGYVGSGEIIAVPGSHTMRIEKPGRYVIWNVISAFHEGRQHTYSESLPAGMRIRVMHDGRELQMDKALAGTESSANSEFARVCTFLVEAPGDYTLTVDGSSEQRLLRVRESLLRKVLLLCGGLGLLSLLGWIGAPVLSVAIEVRRHRLKKRMSQRTK